MGIPLMVTVAGLRSAYAAGKSGTLSDTMTRPQNRYCWQPILSWGGSQFVDENLLFMLAVTKYQQTPSKAAMDFIYSNFIGSTHGKRAAAPRSINISAPARERSWELQTGAWTKFAPGGCRANVFDPALQALGDFLNNDLNLRFQKTLNEPADRQFTMVASQGRLIDDELAALKRVGINL
jgi:hypothetical protein